MTTTLGPPVASPGGRDRAAWGPVGQIPATFDRRGATSRVVAIARHGVGLLLAVTAGCSAEPGPDIGAVADAAPSGDARLDAGPGAHSSHHGPPTRAGCLDPTFDAAVADQTVRPLGVGVTGDGRIVVAGETMVAPVDWRILGLTEDGSRDRTFASDGVLDGAPGTCPGYGCSMHAFAMTPDGHLLVGGIVDGASVVVRYDSHGALDPSFGAGGRADLVVDELEIPTSIAVDAAGRVVVATAGRIALPGTWELVVHRLLPDGAHDPAFGDAGVTGRGLAVGIGADSGELALDALGRILVTRNLAWNSPTTVVLRFLDDGSADRSFGQDGSVSLDGGWYGVKPVGIGATSSGTLLIGGFVWLEGAEQPQAGAIGLAEDGTPTATAVGAAGCHMPVGEAARVIDDHLLVAASICEPPGTGPVFALMRFDATPALDPRFAGDDCGGDPAVGRAQALAVQPDGKLVVAGSIEDNVVLGMTVARYLGSRRHPPAPPR